LKKKGKSGLTVEEEVRVLIMVRERLLQGRHALVDLQRPTCLEEGVVEPALRMAVTALHSVKDIEAFGLHLKVHLSLLSRFGNRKFACD
jgi:hypothetical protein